MPSLLGRFFSFSFRTERLIMNIIGLINSTFDWNPLKWTNQLEQIQNISLSYSTLILETIGEDMIKTVLSWIVIARIVIAHVYTFSYLMNIYSILTWSRPNLLLPWLILSFFKNVVLEVIVLAVCLLLWYDKRFSLAIFLEFVLVKVIPLILATYNWYSNSCLFLQLRHRAKMYEIKKSLKSDVNYLSNRLYTKFAESKHKFRSLTTLLSYESYETYDSRDTISRIMDDVNLTPAQKTMKMLGLTQQDVIEARIRGKERTIHKKLTEIEDDLLNINKAMDKKIFLFDEEYEEQIKAMMKMSDDEEEIKTVGLTAVDKSQSAPTEPRLSIARGLLKIKEKFFDEPKSNHPKEAATIGPSLTEKGTESKEQDSSPVIESERDQQIQFVSKENTKELQTMKIEEENEENSCDFKNEENSNDSTKGISSFYCNCFLDDSLMKEIKQHCCSSDETSLKSFLPKGTPGNDNLKQNLELNDTNNKLNCENVHFLAENGLQDERTADNCGNQNSIKGNRYVRKLEDGGFKYDVSLDQELKQESLIVNRMENNVEILENPYLVKLKEKLKMQSLTDFNYDLSLDEELKQESPIINKMGYLEENYVEILDDPYLQKLEEKLKMEDFNYDLSLDEELKQESPVINEMGNLEENYVEILDDPYLQKLEEKLKMEDFNYDLSLDEELKQESPVINKMRNLEENYVEILEDPYLQQLNEKLKMEDPYLQKLEEKLKIEDFNYDLSLDEELKQESPVINKMGNLEENYVEILEDPYLQKLEEKLKMEDFYFDQSLDEELKQEPLIVNNMGKLEENDVEIFENPYLEKLKEKLNRDNFNYDLTLDEELNEEPIIFNKTRNFEENDMEMLENPYLKEPQNVNKMENVQKTEYKILENIKEDPYLKRLVTQAKLKKEPKLANRMDSPLKNIKQDPSMDDKSKEEIRVEIKIEDIEKSPSPEKILKQKVEKELKIDSKIPVLEDRKQGVLRITNKIKDLLENYREHKAFKDFIAEDRSVQQIVNQIEAEQKDKVSIGTQNFSKVVRGTSAQPLEDFGIVTTIDLGESEMNLKTEHEMLNTMVPMKSAVLIDTNSTRKRGSYKSEIEEYKTKVNVPNYLFGDSTLQCFIQEFENWKPFTHRTGIQPPLKYGVETSHCAVQSARNISSQTRNYENIDRYKVTVSSSPRSITHPETQVSQDTQVSEQYLDPVSIKSNHHHKPSPTVPGKDSHQNIPNLSPKISNSFKGRSNRSKAQLKRKLSKKQNVIDEETYLLNIEIQEPVKHHEDRKKQPPNSSRSPSNKSVCECKMQELKAKCSPSSESKLEKKEESRRSKTDIYETATWTEDGGGPQFTAVIYRKKPPVYMKKGKTEESLSGRTSPSVKNPQKARSKSSKDDKETRILKAFNKDTLWRYKKELEAKRKVPSSKNSVDLISEQSKPRTRVRKSNSKHRASPNAKSIPEQQVNKENRDAMVEVDSSTICASSRLANEEGRSGKGSNEGSTCSKLTKVNKATNRVLDRILTIQKQGQKRPATDTDTRKQATKYTRLKKMVDEEVVVASSSKRLEGVQKGRELDRTPGKEDIRSTNGSRRPSPRVENNEANKNLKKEENCSLMTIKPIVNQEVTSTWSSSTINQGDEETPSEDGKPHPTTTPSKPIPEPEEVPEEPILEDSKVQELPAPIIEIETAPEAEETNSNVSEAPEAEETKSYVLEAPEAEETKSYVLEAPEAEETKINVPEAPEAEETKSNVLEAPEAEETKSNILEAPEAEETKSYVLEAPEAEETKSNILEAPEAEETKSNVLEAPEAEEIKSNVLEAPEAEETNSNVSEAPETDSEDTQRPTTFTDFTRSIDVSHLIHGVVLTNANAPRSKSPRLRDIVDDNTSRLLREALSYQSMDSIFDFAEDSLNINDIMNNRHLHTLDDGFVCQPSRDAVDVFSNELPVVSGDPSSLVDTIPLIRQEVHDLDDQDQGNCNLIITIDEDLASEDLQGVNLVGFQLNDLLLTVGESLRALSAQEFNLQHLGEPRVENPPLKENSDEEDDEEESEEDDQGLRFIREDIFTDIRFPIVINWADLLDVSNQEPERLNLNELEDQKKVKEESMLAIEGDKSVFLSNFRISSEPEKSKHEESEENCLDHLQSLGSCKDERNSRMTMYFEAEIKINGSQSEEIGTGVAEDVEETVGYKIEEVFEDSDTNIRLGGFKDEEEEIVLIEQTVNLEKIEKIGRRIQLRKMRSRQEEATLIEETLKLNPEETNIVEIEIVEEIDRIEEEEITLIEEDWKSKIDEIANESDDEDEDKVTEDTTETQKAKPEMSLLITCIFWVSVFWFFVQDWYRKLQSIGQARSTLSLRPFDVHSAPMSTAKLVERIEQQQEEDDLLKRASENDSQFTDSQISSDFMAQISSGIIEIRDDDLEETMEDFEIPSFLDRSSPLINKDAEFDKKVFEIEVENFGEEEIKTLRFVEANDSSSIRLFSEHEDETTEYCVLAKTNVDEEDIEEIIHERWSEKDKALPKGETIAEEKIEEAGGSSETKTSPEALGLNLQYMDSFDSTYSKISGESKQEISDLNVSSIEEFEDS